MTERVKRELRNTRNRLPYTFITLFRMRLAGCSVSGRNMLHTMSTSPTARITAKTPVHDVTPAISPPTTGAHTGAMPLMAPSRAMKLASSRPVYMSADMLLAITMPPAPASPCSTRMALNINISPENMHSSDATTKSSIEPTNMRLRPYLSVSGPMNS